jgi:hypothetical protein
MVQKMLKTMKNWASYAFWKWRGWFAKTKHNSLVFFLYISPLPLTLKKKFNYPFSSSNIILKNQFEKEMKKIFSLEVKWGDSSMN